MEISLSMYKFSANLKRQKQLINLTQKIGNKTIFETIGALLSQPAYYESEDDDVVPQKTISFQEWHSGDPSNGIFSNTVTLHDRDYYQYLYLTVDGGESGQAAEVREREREDPLFNITPNQILARKHQVFIAMPCNPQVYAGMIIFTNYGRHGIKTLFSDIFKRAINEATLDIGPVTVKVNPLSNIEEVYKLLDERDITKLRLIKAYEDDDMLYRKVEQVYYDPSRVKFIDSVKHMFANRRVTQTGIVALDNFEATDISVTIKLDNNREKVIGLKNLDTVSFVEYISYHPALQYDENLIPTSDSIETIMKSAFEEYAEHLSHIGAGNNEEFNDSSEE